MTHLAQTNTELLPSNGVVSSLKVVKAWMLSLHSFQSSLYGIIKYFCKQLQPTQIENPKILNFLFI